MPTTSRSSGSASSRYPSSWPKCLATVLKKRDHYHVANAVKLGNYNIGRQGALLTLPLYMGFLLDFETDESLQLDDLDIEAINRMATGVV